MKNVIVGTMTDKKNKNNRKVVRHQCYEGLILREAKSERHLFGWRFLIHCSAQN